MLRVELQIEKCNDILAHTTLELCGYQCDDLTFNFTEGRNPILGRIKMNEPYFSSFLLTPQVATLFYRTGTQGLGKQCALLIGGNQTSHVQCSSL